MPAVERLVRSLGGVSECDEVLGGLLVGLLGLAGAVDGSSGSAALWREFALQWDRVRVVLEGSGVGDAVVEFGVIAGGKR